MSTNIDAIIERIKKLLQLANSPNENEAKAAASKASALLLKYNLELQKVKDRDFEYGEMHIIDIPQLKWHQKHIADLMENFFFVRIIFSYKYSDRKGKYIQTINFVGTKANCQIASYVFAYLNDVYPRLWWNYKDAQYKLGNKLYKSHRDSYFTGLTQGISDLLRKERFRVQEEMGLVLVKDEKLDEHITKRTGGKCKNTSEKEFDLDIARQGYKDGLEVKLRKPIETDKKEDEVLFITAGEK